MGTRSKTRSERATTPGRTPGHAQKMFHTDKRTGRYIAGEKPVTFTQALELLLSPVGIAARKEEKAKEAAAKVAKAAETRAA